MRFSLWAQKQNKQTWSTSVTDRTNHVVDWRVTPSKSVIWIARFELEIPLELDPKSFSFYYDKKIQQLPGWPKSGWFIIINWKCLISFSMRDTRCVFFLSWKAVPKFWNKFFSASSVRLALVLHLTVHCAFVYLWWAELQKLCAPGSLRAHHTDTKIISQVDALFRKIGPIVLYVGSSQPPNKEAVNQKKNKEAQFCCSTHDSELTHRNTLLFLSHWTNHSNTILISQSSLELSFPQFYKDFIWINSISQTSRMPGPCSEESRTDWLFTHVVVADAEIIRKLLDY